jgi:glycosyltransferase involved in cell wall biosynthesis
MKILFLAPLPPPINGQSLQSKVLYDNLVERHEVVLIDTMKDSHKDGIDSFKRILDVLKILFQVLKKVGDVDVIYLQISESLAGNIRDILIFLILGCNRKIKYTYIHLHGGSIKNWVYDKSIVLFSLNKFFIKRMAGVVVLGKSHIPIFSNMIDSNRIHIVHNFAEDLFFNNLEKINVKYSNLKIIKVLFLSNMILGKGHNDLLDGYLLLNEVKRNKLQIDFAGAFPNGNEKDVFLSRILNQPNIRYHGVVLGEGKRKLLEDAHVLCFPSYLFEGQGICLIEGYAAGCVGMTTGKSGISDIFKNKINGYQIEGKNPNSIKFALEQIMLNKDGLLKIGQNNFLEATQKYSVLNHCNKINSILLNNKDL